MHRSSTMRLFVVCAVILFLGGLPLGTPYKINLQLRSPRPKVPLPSTDAIPSTAPGTATETIAQQVLPVKATPPPQLGSDQPTSATTASQASLPATGSSGDFEGLPTEATTVTASAIEVPVTTDIPAASELSSSEQAAEYLRQTLGDSAPEGVVAAEVPTYPINGNPETATALAQSDLPVISDDTITPIGSSSNFETPTPSISVVELEPQQSLSGISAIQGSAQSIVATVDGNANDASVVETSLKTISETSSNVPLSQSPPATVSDTTAATGNQLPSFNKDWSGLFKRTTSVGSGSSPEALAAPSAPPPSTATTVLESKFNKGLSFLQQKLSAGPETVKVPQAAPSSDRGLFDFFNLHNTGAGASAGAGSSGNGLKGMTSSFSPPSSPALPVKGDKNFLDFFLHKADLVKSPPPPAVPHLTEAAGQRLWGQPLPSIGQLDIGHTLQDLALTPHQFMWVSASLADFASLAAAFYALLLFLPVVVSEDKVPGEPYGDANQYDRIEAKKYFRRRPLLTVVRSLEIALKSSVVLLAVLSDVILNRLKDPRQEAIRAQQVCELLTDLGPAFIKVGQSLSIRKDLLRPAYLTALTQLQDRVPSFPTSTARKIIAKELGRPVDEIFTSGLDPTAKVVAAASLGQVFKARINSTEVAVKIQRPNIMEAVALDMHILREAAPILKRVFKLKSDVSGIVDDWGKGFVDELDYRKEAANAATFTKMIAVSPLSKSVFAPEVLNQYSTRRVLTTRWVEGERLEKSSSEDITKLCSLAMNTYLTMLLDGPILHCDPHPGNLRRTPDGRLCIMDWGLTTSISPEMQVTFVEHVAHLVSRDYAKVPSDLVKLGFVPKEKESTVMDSGVVEVLANIYGQWANGGGAAKIDINGVVTQLSGLAKTYGRLFQLPPYFAYIARAFAVLEGIGLTNDPDYAILGECLPYISQRLLVSADEKTEGALQTFIFGAEKDNVDRVIDAERLALLIEGVSKYSNSVDGLRSSSNGDAKNNATSSQQVLVEKIDTLADALFEYVFSPAAANRNSAGTNSSDIKLTPLQKVVIEEASKIISAAVRRVWRSARYASGTLPTGRSLLGTIFDPIGLFTGSNLIEFDQQDMRVLNATSFLVGIIRDQLPVTSTNQLLQMNPQTSARIAQVVISKMWTKRAELGRFSAYIVAEILKQTAKRLELSKLKSKYSSRTLSNAPPGGSRQSSTTSTRPAGNTSGLDDEQQGLRSEFLLTEEDQLTTSSVPRIDKARALLAAVQTPSPALMSPSPSPPPPSSNSLSPAVTVVVEEVQSTADLDSIVYSDDSDKTDPDRVNDGLLNVAVGPDITDHDKTIEVEINDTNKTDSNNLNDRLLSVAAALNTDHDTAIDNDDSNKVDPDNASSILLNATAAPVEADITTVV